jgi:hypothetical protein
MNATGRMQRTELNLSTDDAVNYVTALMEIGRHAVPPSLIAFLGLSRDSFGLEEAVQVCIFDLPISRIYFSASLTAEAK